MPKLTLKVFMPFLGLILSLCLLSGQALADITPHTHWKKDKPYL